MKYQNLSIRLKLTLWFSLMLLAITGVTFFSLRAASGTVLRSTLRDYLIGTVEENVGKITYVTSPSADRDQSLYLVWGEGFLQIDLDFMQVVNDVRTALYTEEGELLYGENPLARHTQELPFTETRVFRLRVEGSRYDLYDRKLPLALPDGSSLWIRGVVSETRSDRQLSDITRLSLILLPLLILAALAAAYFLIQKSLQPLRQMEEAAGRISRGEDLKERVARSPGENEVTHLADSFNHMLDRLESSFEHERRFTSDASHELRTPTSVILAQSDYSLERERTPEEYKEALTVIRKQARRMRSLIGDMLSYTRMEQRPEQYEKLPLDFSALVRETAEQMAQIETDRIALSCDIEEDLTLQGNAGLLTRLLQNLIGNAYRYGRDGGHIRVGLSRAGEDLLLTVADDGRGISQEDLPHIFERFYRGDASRTEQGTGLGLSMVERIAKLHGGEIHVESEVGKGSEFKILFKKQIL